MKKLLLLSLCFLLLFVTHASAQNRTITGIVTAQDDGLPIPGVSVRVKGSQTGTVTGGDGVFLIKTTSANPILVFSFLGYTSVEKAATTDRVNVAMKVDSKQLTEVVVTSYGIARSKKSLGYGTAEVSGASITATQNTNFTNSLDGKVSGVQVSGTGGAFTGSSIVIRGNVTLIGSNQPLVIVDGLPIDNGGGGQSLQNGPSASNRGIDINPEDIESTTVLKGAAATVLYGSRAASGAILITTKRGSKNQKNNIEFSTSFGFGNPDRLPEFQNQYGQGNNGVYNNAATTSWGPEIKGQQVTNFFGNKETLTAYPDNLKDFFQTAHTVQNNISFTGGGDKTTYRVAYGNDHDTYVIPGNVLNRNNLTINARSEITSKLRVGTSLSFVNSLSARTQQGNQLSNPLFRGYIIPRSYDLQGLPYQDANGLQTWFGTTDNPYWTIQHNKYHDEINRLLGNINLTYDILSWLTADLKVGEDYYGSNNHSIDDIGNHGGGNSGSNSVGVGGLNTNDNLFRNTDAYFTLTGNRSYGDFNFSFTVGGEYLDNYQQGSSVNAYTLTLPGFENLSNATQYFPTNFRQESRLFGAFGDFVVDYKKWFTVNIKGRNDWDSTLPVKNQSFFYPAIATSFILTDAVPSLKTNIINEIKLRANYGKVGKNPLGPYNTGNTYGAPGIADGFGPAINFPFNGLSAFALNGTAGNPNLQPEFTKELEIGGEFGFFNNRLTIDGSYYSRHTTNAILFVPFSSASGIGSAVENAGELRSKGVELSITGVPVKSGKFEWDIMLNATHNKSTVVSLAPGVQNIFLGGFTTPNIQLDANDEYGQIYGSAYQRNAQGQLLISASGLPLATSGTPKIGNPNPKWIYGLSNTISYNGLSLYFLIDVRQGGDIYSRNFADVERNGDAAVTAATPRFNADGTPTTPMMFQGVYAPGTPKAGQPNTTAVSEQLYYGNTGKYVAAEGYIHDITWYRLREATLSYSLPKNLLSHTPFGKASLGIYGRNLILITPHYKHFDPEQNALGIGNASGLEFNSLPVEREMGINLRLNF